MSIKNIRIATEKDAEALSRLNQIFNGGDRVDPKWIVDSMKNNDELIVVATLDDKVAGFACAQSFRSFCYSNKHGEITEMYVEDAARGKGLATEMISLLEEKLVERGVQSIKILTGKENEAALRTYLGSGYILEDDQVLEKKIKY